MRFISLVFRVSTVFACTAILAASAPAQSIRPPGSQSAKNPEASLAQNYVLVGAGDIVWCHDPSAAAATAKLIEHTPGTVFALGDLVYDAISLASFQGCYAATWGRFKDRTRPALGNHEYVEPSAAPYFQYWGAQAGPPGKGYYSYDLAAWHVVVLNTNCASQGVGGCAKDSPQEVWLRQDLADHANSCIVVYGHHALFSSGIFPSHAIHPELKPLWEDLYAAHADLILAGHEHSYERFAPQDPEGRPDPSHGIREIVVGTGGRSHDLLGQPLPNSEVQNVDTFGVLKLTLSPHDYTWEFLPQEGKTFHDSGAGTCHNASTRDPREKSGPK